MNRYRVVVAWSSDVEVGAVVEMTAADAVLLVAQGALLLVRA